MTLMHVATFTHAATATAGASESEEAADARWLDAPDTPASDAAVRLFARNATWTLRRAEAAAEVIGF